MKKKVTSVSFGLVNRRMLRGGMILSLLLSLFLCSVFVVYVANAKSVGDIKQFLPMAAIVLGISFALCASVYAYLCFTAHDDVMKSICGKTQFDYRSADVFRVNKTHLNGCLDDDDNWFCICDCDVYHFVGNVKVGPDSSAKEPTYSRLCTDQRIMLCFSSGNALKEFGEGFETYGYNYWRNDGNGGLERCVRPNLANLRLVASA